MKLWYTPTSPYVRKAFAAAHHHGLAERIELLHTASSFSPASAHNQDNPLGRIPVLQTDDGRWLYSSSVIVEYFDATGGGSRLLPEGAGRLDALNLHALVEGMLENTMIMVAEKMLRPENEWWEERHRQIIGRNIKTAAVLAGETARRGTVLDIGTLYAVCAVDYFDFRAALTGADALPDMPELRRWAAEMNALYPCLAATRPRAA